MQLKHIAWKTIGTHELIANDYFVSSLHASASHKYQLARLMAARGHDNESPAVAGLPLLLYALDGLLLVWPECH